VLVDNLVKLHNFCIREKDEALELTALHLDTVMSNEEKYTTLEASTSSDRSEEVALPTELIGAGDHFQDIS
jgi:hypothetical protein